MIWRSHAFCRLCVGAYSTVSLCAICVCLRSTCLKKAPVYEYWFAKYIIVHSIYTHLPHISTKCMEMKCMYDS